MINTGRLELSIKSTLFAIYLDKTNLIGTFVSAILFNKKNLTLFVMMTSPLVAYANNSIRILTGVCAFLILLHPTANAQCTPIANATAGISLTYVQTGGTNASGVAYNPILDLYYTAIAGNSGFPLETYDGTGAPLNQTNTGFDIRGLWWNYNLSTLESNGYNTGGIWSFNLDGSGYALNTGTSIFTGNNQPNSQSVGDYDCVADEIVYYSSGTVVRRNRATNALIGTTTITGLPVTTGHLNNNTIFFTDCTGHEYGVVDYVNKRVYFIDKSTGAYAGMSQLPGTAITNNSFRASWANGMAWLYNTGTRTWQSYNVLNSIDGPCMITLPITLLDFEAFKQDNSVLLDWSTSSEFNNDYFSIEKSIDGEHWELLATVDGAGTSTTLLTYSTWDRNPNYGLNYYRLKQTDTDGAFEYADLKSVYFSSGGFDGISVYPNPATTHVKVVGTEKELDELVLYSNLGQKLELSVVKRAGEFLELDISYLNAGVYYFKTLTTTQKLVVN